MRFAIVMIFSVLLLPSAVSQSGSTDSAPWEAPPGYKGFKPNPDDSGVYQIGHGVSAPVLIYQTKPKLTEEQLRDDIRGPVLLTLVVDAQGKPQKVRVIRPIGMGHDEAAIEAVKQYRFRPSRLNGKAVAVRINIEVCIDRF